MLEAGPVQQRAKFDPYALVAPQAGDLDLEAVGKEEAMPWQTDGRRWHTVDRVTTEGKPCQWDGTMLTWLDELVHEAGTFGDTNWSQRLVVEIAAPKATQGWFLHALTGMEWQLRLVFRVSKKAFNGPCSPKSSAFDRSMNPRSWAYPSMATTPVFGSPTTRAPGNRLLSSPIA